MVYPLGLQNLKMHTKVANQRIKIWLKELAAYLKTERKCDAHVKGSCNVCNYSEIRVFSPFWTHLSVLKSDVNYGCPPFSNRDLQYRTPWSLK